MINLELPFAPQQLDIDDDPYKAKLALSPIFLNPIVLFRPYTCPRIHGFRVRVGSKLIIGVNLTIY